MRITNLNKSIKDKPVPFLSSIFLKHHGKTHRKSYNTNNTMNVQKKVIAYESKKTTVMVRQRVYSVPCCPQLLTQNQIQNEPRATISQTFIKAESRNPLSDIQPNLINLETCNNNNLLSKIKKTFSYKSKSTSTFNAFENQKEIKKLNFSSSIPSTSLEAGPSNKRSIPEELKFVTIRKKPEPVKADLNKNINFEENDLFSDDDSDEDVFNKTRVYFNEISPIEKNDRTGENVVLVSAAPKKLVRKNKVNKNAKGDFDLSIFEEVPKLGEEYLENYIDHLLTKDHKHVVTEVSLKLKVDVKARGMVVNWLIKTQPEWYMSRETFLKTVRLFDWILSSTEVPINMYQLVAATCFWIANKFDAVKQVTSERILRLTGGAYTISQLLNMEIKIYNYINHTFDVVEPCIFLEYYLLKAKITNTDVFWASYYILETIALSSCFSTFPPSLLAASALYFALETVIEDVTVWETLRNCKIYYEIEETLPVRKRINSIFECIGTKKYPFLNCYYKYATQDTNFIAFVIKIF